ncbi:uncharacterized protein N7446_000993 [Penicillium canescens]|uniref:DNA repair protein RAD51 homolog 3 n=1 Tax=Penicillium canescens TaxID=5083 RepID=A0AAD6I3D0_PENCN|nr:uncharacterized protein N7446_000993 [Penicillium canescens]KAJ6029944.1 hypothetical protein N7460_010210 [Penicillium canescens]KAJ6060322.1 hypothetical protein N7444_002176 [Penicillium canescens]KAJ6078057.1 hypothetical protein N7446_000993 [Penicillium canescens]
MTAKKDTRDLDTSSEDTLPLLSAPATQTFSSSAHTRLPNRIGTGARRLDEALDGQFKFHRRPTGIVRGQITEVWGPPGSGKTSLGLSIARSALQDGGKVVWIDTSSPLPAPRLQQMGMNVKDFVYLRAPTLPHLLALLGKPPKNFPPVGTTLIVIDSVSSLFQAYFTGASELKDQLVRGKIKDKNELHWLLNRRWNVTNELSLYLTRFALKRIAVLALDQTHTKIKGQVRATLGPTVWGGGWEKSVLTRVVIYRGKRGERFAEVTKRGGNFIPKSGRLVVRFRIERDGCHDDKPSGISIRRNLPARTPVIRPSNAQGHIFRSPKAPTPSPLSPALPSSKLQNPRSPLHRSPFPKSPLTKSRLSTSTLPDEPSNPVHPPQPAPTPKKRKVEEVADSQDELSEDDFADEEFP